MSPLTGGLVRSPPTRRPPPPGRAAVIFGLAGCDSPDGMAALRASRPPRPEVPGLRLYLECERQSAGELRATACARVASRARRAIEAGSSGATGGVRLLADAILLTEADTVPEVPEDAAWLATGRRRRQRHQKPGDLCRSAARPSACVGPARDEARAESVPGPAAPTPRDKPRSGLPAALDHTGGRRTCRQERARHRHDGPDRTSAHRPTPPAVQTGTKRTTTVQATDDVHASAALPAPP